MSLSAAGSAALDIGSAIYSARQNEENQRRSLRFQRQYAKNKYQWQMADMKSAGLNPILAAGQSPGGASGGAAASGGPGTTNLTSAAAAHRMAKKQENLLDSEIQKNRDQAWANSAQAFLYRKQAAGQSYLNWRAEEMNKLWNSNKPLFYMEHSPTGVGTAKGLFDQGTDLYKALKNMRNTKDIQKMKNKSRK